MLRRYFLQQLASLWGLLVGRKVIQTKNDVRPTKSEAFEVGVNKFLVFDKFFSPINSDAVETGISRSIALNKLLTPIAHKKEDLIVTKKIKFLKKLSAMPVSAEAANSAKNLVVYSSVLSVKANALPAIAEREILFKAPIAAVGAGTEETALSATLQTEIVAQVKDADTSGVVIDTAISFMPNASPAPISVIPVYGNKSVVFENLAELASHVLISANKKMVMESNATLVYGSARWYAPRQSNNKLYVKSVYSAIRDGSNLHITNVNETKGGVDNG